MEEWKYKGNKRLELTLTVRMDEKGSKKWVMKWSTNHWDVKFQIKVWDKIDKNVKNNGCKV